jgi:hypothetical protein
MNTAVVNASRYPRSLSKAIFTHHFSHPLEQYLHITKGIHGAACSVRKRLLFQAMETDEGEGPPKRTTGLSRAERHTPAAINILTSPNSMSTW